jgi:hypothetical protein
MIIKQCVRDLDQFQRAFDKLKPMRERHGLKDMGQYRSADEIRDFTPYFGRINFEPK